mmetsp:Transcript_22800/g.58007  ORF Transcript_22800/g.58007 Transcript_22800/m.58007 type:complete len:187 (-) Transcript_22800:238-798(-)|eukprot:CAMPEP_0202865884 /NCGR_PEP_ID=MMETSP1391-20130828/6611_1 /ASSEMBLY_ACC=CAM_ASM_000867 /TAXON_ID=1034604 /ORGANISM="Chlamydomonas leiostraca, Strain SAG 11-49" /LENGTH=186 /DNA_ID=CAMNT_0049545769 /DNA_START=80 /DNA_END=643 /DNA_ORIENTATION=+
MSAGGMGARPLAALGVAGGGPADRVKITLEVTPRKGTAHIHYKQDGGRFPGGYESTVKLCTGCEYVARLTWQPALTVKSVHVQRQGALLPFSLQAPGATSEAVGSWAGTWMCSLPKSGKSSRVTIDVIVDTEERGEVVLPLQAKVYKPTDTACLHGNRLRSVNYVAVPSSDRGLRVASTAFFSYPV